MCSSTSHEESIGDIESAVFRDTLTDFLHGLDKLGQEIGFAGIQASESGDLVDSFLW
jgi:hypothetical protein